MRKFIYGPGIDEPICMIIIDDEAETKYYYHFDGLGSAVALSNENKEIVERYSYDVFGQTSNTSDVNNPYLFTGRRYDTETALYYYRARYYDYYTGRFMQADPIGYGASLNLYTYCGNNPLNWVDPWGLCEDRSGLITDQIGVVLHGSLFALSSGAHQLTQLPPVPSFSEQSSGNHPYIQIGAFIADMAALAASAVGEFTQATFGFNFEDSKIQNQKMFRIHLTSYLKRMRMIKEFREIQILKRTKAREEHIRKRIEAR